jgi:tetratricopeptide (TPR) repeat protein
LGLLHFSRSEFEQADELLTETASHDVELRDAFVVITALYSAGSSRAHLGRIDAALSSYEQALGWAQGNADPVRLPMVLSALAWLYSELGQCSLADDFARRSGCCKDPASGAWGLVASQMNLLEPGLNPIVSMGKHFCRPRESEQSSCALPELERGLRQQPWWHWSFHLRAEACRCQHSLHEGDYSGAERRARALLEQAASHRAAKYVAIAHRILAEVQAERGELLQARSELQQALAVIQGAMPLLAWKLHAGLGRVARELGDTVAARSAYAAAQALILEIAGNISDEALRSGFLSSEAALEVRAFGEDSSSDALLAEEGLQPARLKPHRVSA